MSLVQGFEGAPLAWLRLAPMRIAAVAALGCVAPAALAQAVGPGEAAPVGQPPDVPTATRLDYRRESAALQITLPTLDDAPFAARLDERESGVPLQIGFPRAVPEGSRGDLLADAIWTALADGTQVTSVTVRAPGAGRLRVALRGLLPAGARVRFFALGQSMGAARDRSPYPVYARGDFTRRGADRIEGEPEEAGGLLWSPIVDGDTLGIEFELPAGVDAADARLQVVRVSHLPPKAAQRSSADGALADEDDESCPLVDVACKSLPRCPRSAVGQLAFTESDGVTYVCTGTVVDSARPDAEDVREAHFLTAHHCISTQAVADSMEIDFLYEVETCGGSDVSADRTTVHAGGELLATDPSTDMSLLALRSPLPTGVCLAAWEAGAAAAQTPVSGVTSITHPDGGPKKFASGDLVTGTYGIVEVSELVVDALVVDWTEGETLGGSSGGGLFAPRPDGGQSLIGTLSGSPDGCGVGNAHGRFDLFYANHARRFLRPDDRSEDDHGGAFAQATGILPNSETTGRIDHGADADLFRLNITEPGTLTVRTTGGADTVGRLVRADGTVVAWNDDGAGSNNFEFTAHVEAGVHYIRVSGYSPHSAGGYRLHVTFTAADRQTGVEIPLFLSASDAGREGFIRLFNASDDDGAVEITAFDDEGVRHGPVTLSVDAQQTRHFNSGDLENGNPSKGLGGGTGSGSGDWRLRFDTALDIEVAAYVRTRDGFLTVLHETVPRAGEEFVVPIFNPASNTRQRSRLRLINPDGSREVRVRIVGQDDAGNPGEGAVKLTLPAAAARTVDAAQMEAGGEAIEGRLGDGQGKWRLFVRAEGEIVVLNLLEGASGHLVNLSPPGPGSP